MERIKMIGGGTAVTNCPFPVGFGGFFQTDPNSIYAGTTWQQKKDVFILAAGDTYPAGSTGGEANHVLTVDEMPEHRHTANTYNATGGSAWTLMDNNKAAKNGFRDGKDGLIGYTGGNQPHNNMPPYYSMPFWIRTA